MKYPQIMTSLSGNQIYDVSGWERHRRDEILYLFKNLASEVYELYNRKGVVIGESVENDTPYHEGMIGYHRKTGKHSITKYDWNLYMDFADKYVV